MKKLLILTAFISSLISANVYACSCMSPAYTEEDVDMAVINFMEAKRDIPSREIMALNTEYVSDFLRADQRVLGALDYLITEVYEDSPEAHQCGMSCERAMNRVYKSTVTYYNSEEQVCTQELKVEMRSNLTGETFSSKVIKKDHPTCE